MILIFGFFKYIYIYIFLFNLIIIIINLSNPWIQPDPCGLGWVRLMRCVELGWIFFNPPWWVGSKNPFNPTQPNLCTSLINISHLIFHMTSLSCPKEVSQGPNTFGKLRLFGDYIMKWSCSTFDCWVIILKRNLC